MSTMFSFQSQLVSIMDALSKTAVLEISKLVEIESKMLKIEITRGRNEISSLTEKLQLMENLLWIAQGRRQDTAGHVMAAKMRDGSENISYGTVEPDGTGPPTIIKSESTWESISSSAAMGCLHQSDSSVELTNPVREQPELIVVKEEPVEIDSGDSASPKERTAEKGIEMATVSRQRNSDVQHLKTSSDQQPMFTENFVMQGSRSPLVGPGKGDTQWSTPHSVRQNTQLTPGHTNLEVEKFYVRNAAPQSFNMSKNVKVHSLRNSATKRFGCLQCGKNFRCFSQLEIHQRSHTGEKPFRCTLCGKRYAQKGHLYTHQRTHTGEKPYRCPICGKGFIQKCTLDMHQRTHTGEKPFVCVKCGKGFTKNCNLKKHMAVHIDPSMNMYTETSACLPTYRGTNGHAGSSNIVVNQP